MKKAQAAWKERREEAKRKGEEFSEEEPFPTPLILRTKETGFHQ